MTSERGGQHVKKERDNDDSSSSSCFSPRWSDLPTDILQVIADKVHTLGILRLRAVCHSWRSSFPPLLSEPSVQFPLKLPCPFSSPSSSLPPTVHCDGEDHVALIETTVYRISPPHDSSNSWLITVEPTSKPNVFSLLDPVTGLKIDVISKILPPERIRINLLNHRISLISKLYRVEYVADGGHSKTESGEIVVNSLSKVVVSANLRKMSELLVVGLQYNGRLRIWRYGDKAWTPIVTSGFRFDDIINYRGTFFAIGGSVGHLVRFDSAFRPITLVPRVGYGERLEHGCVSCAKLIESRGELYLVDLVDGWILIADPAPEVLKLDDTGSDWYYELDLKGMVFFLRKEEVFVIDKEYFSGCIGNCIYFDLFKENPKVYNMNTGSIRYVGMSVDSPRFYWPPPSWVCDTTTTSSG